MFTAKIDYSTIFASEKNTHDHLYADRSKTSAILGDSAFIDAWLSSRDMHRVTAIIRSEALKGDIPSIKQMIWLGDLYANDAENMTTNADDQLKIKIGALTDRIMFSQKAIDLGLTEQSYTAMASCAKLYMTCSKAPFSIEDEVVRSSLSGIIKYATMFLESGYDDPELLQDTKNTLAYYGPMARLLGL